MREHVKISTSTARGALRACSVDALVDQRLLDALLLAQGWLCVYKKGDKGFKKHEVLRLSPCTEGLIILLYYFFCFQSFCASVPLEELVPSGFCLWLVDAGCRVVVVVLVGWGLSELLCQGSRVLQQEL